MTGRSAFANAARSSSWRQRICGRVVAPRSAPSDRWRRLRRFGRATGRRKCARSRSAARRPPPLPTPLRRRRRGPSWRNITRLSRPKVRPLASLSEGAFDSATPRRRGHAAGNAADFSGVRPRSADGSGSSPSGGETCPHARRGERSALAPGWGATEAASGTACMRGNAAIPPTRRDRLLYARRPQAREGRATCRCHDLSARSARSGG